MSMEDCGSTQQSTSIDPSGIGIIAFDDFEDEDPYIFSKAGGSQLHFDEELRKKCDANGVKKPRQLRGYKLRKSIQIDICRHMYVHQYYYKKGLTNPTTNFDDFYDMYGLRDTGKDKAARNFFINEIRKCAMDITEQVAADGGISWPVNTNAFTSQPKAQKPIYQRGYKYIIDRNLSINCWEGIKKQFSEVSDIKRHLEYGLQRQLYTEEEILELRQHLTEALAWCKGSIPSTPIVDGKSQQSSHTVKNPLSQDSNVDSPEEKNLVSPCF